MALQGTNFTLTGDSKGAINHSRIRMGLSALNKHRRKNNFVDDSSCPKCGHKPESESHFFLHCPAYVAQRQALFDGPFQVYPHELRSFTNNASMKTKLP